jgi:drug/metabolite transporter (DMT)-like permease
MVLFFIIAGLCYIGIPSIYKTAVVEKMNDNERIYAVWFTLLYLFIIILVLIIDGKNTGNSTQFIIAVFLAFLSVLIYVLTKDDVIDNSNFSSFEFLVFISSVFSRHMTQSTIIINCLILLFITYFLLYGLSLLTDKNGDKIIDSSDINHIAMWIGITIIPFIIGLLVWIFPSKT